MLVFETYILLKYYLNKKLNYIHIYNIFVQQQEKGKEKKKEKKIFHAYFRWHKKKKHCVDSTRLRANVIS